jgi:hypothetical protein
MQRHRFEFAWHVSPAGYRWVQASCSFEGTEHSGPALIAADVTELEAATPQTLKPASDPMLFRLLAETAPNETDILAFANSYGNLHYGNELSLLRPGKGKNNSVVRGVLLSTWQWHIAALRRLTGLWDLIQRKDVKALGRHIRWELTSREGPTEGPTVYFDSHPRDLGRGAPPSLGDHPVTHVIASPASDRQRLESFRPDDPILPAKTYLHDQLAAALFNATDDVRVTMTWDSRREHPAVAYECPSLMSAVWLQFATVVSENLTYGRCLECGKWFEVAPNASRASRRFCSTACRSKAYRERQDWARQLFMTAKTFEQIAQELDSDVATVRRWITGIKD